MNAARKIQSAVQTTTTATPWQPPRSAQEPEMELICRWEPTGLDYPKMEARWVLVQKG
ncbi:MAG: hypothetical protein Fur0042_26780 [Cyanophyceae cyanobacterium]